MAKTQNLIVQENLTVIGKITGASFEISTSGMAVKLVNKTGLENLMKERKIKNLVDYVFGIEVGMDRGSPEGDRTGFVLAEYLMNLRTFAFLF
jgi:type II restriction enzyme